ncbi:MAG: helix-turn-helix domain-containing protein [Oscillospiraceae bacterium]|nr:helix-turn-helix domain-containing protein [Oscillospiraceae bacterium]
MTLGQKIKEARIERKMTQRDVVGDYITRNMLSKIENDSATPSVKTLEHIAKVLNLPAGYFMSDLTTDDGEPSGITGARKAYKAGNYPAALDMINAVDLAKTSHEDEACLLHAKCCTGIAEQAYHDGDVTRARACARDALKHNAAGLYFDLRCELVCCEILMLCAIQLESQSEYRQYEKRYLAESSKGNIAESFSIIQALFVSGRDGLATGLKLLENIHAENISDPWVRAMYMLLSARAKIEAGDIDGAIKLLETAEIEAGKNGGKLIKSEIYSYLERCHKAKDNFRMAYHYATLRLEI